MNIRQRKVTPEQQQELIRLWMNGETEAMFKKQKELGVERKYAPKRAYDLGLVREPNRSRDYMDPRWKWALERGAIVAP